MGTVEKSTVCLYIGGYKATERLTIDYPQYIMKTSYYLLMRVRREYEKMVSDFDISPSADRL